jgi:Domain of unknown function (DUF6249)
MNPGFHPGIIIPVVAIVFGIMIPIVSIVMDYRRRKLLSEERRAMIEKGMVPPPLDERTGSPPQDHETGRACALRRGITLLSLGVGLAVAFYMVQYVFPNSLHPRTPTFGLMIAASIVGFLGLGNLIYYAVTSKKQN